MYSERRRRRKKVTDDLRLFFKTLLDPNIPIETRNKAGEEIWHSGLRMRKTDQPRGCVTHSAPPRGTQELTNFLKETAKIAGDKTLSIEFRKTAISILEEWGVSTEVGAVAQIDDPALAESVIEALKTIGGPDATEKILAYLKFDNEGVRQSALGALLGLVTSPLSYVIGNSLSDADRRFVGSVAATLRNHAEATTCFIEKMLANDVLDFFGKYSK